ncbi:Ribosomal RNA large subunit methyltransferase E [Candidatus Trichorickettsia mobilis]|uniref:Ribosomal RNA large subunit methyltransferase E n=1 Tax=Candidatus Trichorickettsia mobilis TaxID=1346319 RepID=A0ABZ0UY60_9RICK|nr:RlmE family RNA methyltransferase [Candidatus Trichorickettsia mobilis]WPY01004.1 Ribosomal RNA large subunit methyltransferase E [Candidatus Trichorickettsia mobilis]
MLLDRNKSVKLKSARTRKASSNQWLQRQLNDPYVAKAKVDGYKSRAAYKLLEIHHKFKLFKPDAKIVDLGAAPGSWSQVAAQLSRSTKINPKYNNIVAVDLLPMETIPGVLFIQKDFLDADTSAIIIDNLPGGADVVISDMAANTTGHNATDYVRTLYLCECALDFALSILNPDGHFISKVFSGGTEHELLHKVKQNFKIVKHFKPAASRKESREYYLIALNRKTNF